MTLILSYTVNHISIYMFITYVISRVSSGSIVSDYGLGFDPRQGQRIFPLSSVSKPALGPTQPPVQWVPGCPFPGGKSAAGA
jgi:hypothetical protein